MFVTDLVEDMAKLGIREYQKFDEVMIRIAEDAQQAQQAYHGYKDLEQAGVVPSPLKESWLQRLYESIDRLLGNWR